MSIARLYRYMTPATSGSPPATPTLSVTDTADGTGGTANISGSTAGSVNSVYYATFSGQSGALTWTLAGSRTSDGAVALTQHGFFIWICISVLNGLSATSAPYYGSLTNATANQLPQRILDAVQTRIKALNLSGLNNSNVVETWLPRAIDDVDAYPRITISPVDKESFTSILTTKDDIGEPVLVAIIDKQSGDISANLARNENWRWLILSALRYQPLAGVPEVQTCYPEPADKLDPGLFDGNLFTSKLLFRFLTRTKRG